MGCRAQADDHGGHHGIEKLARAPRPGRVSFLHLESVAVADIDRAVGAPFPAAVVSEEMMAMAVMMTMPKMTMAKMTMTMPVASTMPTMPTVTVASSERLTRDGQRSRGQRQRSNRGRNDRLDLRHRRLLGWAGARIALR